jgi:hypothetical protein
MKLQQLLADRWTTEGSWTLQVYLDGQSMADDFDARGALAIKFMNYKEIAF